MLICAINAPNCGLKTVALLAGLSALERASLEGDTPVCLAGRATSLRVELFGIAAQSGW